MITHLSKMQALMQMKCILQLLYKPWEKPLEEKEIEVSTDLNLITIRSDIIVCYICMLKSQILSLGALCEPVH